MDIIKGICIQTKEEEEKQGSEKTKKNLAATYSPAH